MSLLAELQQLMVDYHFRPDQRFSQNFVIDEKIVAKLIESAKLKKSDVVLEIGCGTGFLTRELLKHCKVVGVESDRVMIEILKNKFSQDKNFVLVEGDFLKAELPKFNKVVSLPPYSISTEIMLKLLGIDFESALLVFQKEFCEKIVSEPGFADYSYLTVLASQKYSSKIPVPNITSSSFFPKPDSYSSLLLLSRKKKVFPVKDFAGFVLFLKGIFRYKNKNLSNALRNHFKIQKNKKLGKKAFEIAEELGLPEEKVNLIEPEEFLELFTRTFEE